MTALFQHYLPPAPAMLPYVSGRFYASQHARAVGGAVAMTANRLYAVIATAPPTARACCEA